MYSGSLDVHLMFFIQNRMGDNNLPAPKLADIEVEKTDEEIHVEKTNKKIDVSDCHHMIIF
jgi:hypothetical protein